MKFLDKINKLADQFEYKLQKIGQSFTQAGTTQLFFDSEDNQIKFAAALQNPKGPIFKVLNDYYTKTQTACSIDLKMNANPGNGASWQLTVNPPDIKSKIIPLLDAEYRKIMNTSMLDRQKMADNKSKQEQAGTGVQDVGSIELS